MKLANLTAPPLALLISTCVPTVAWLPLLATATPRFETVQGFELGPEQPRCRSLVADAQGNLYGTTPSGGSRGGGTLFKMSPDGTISTVYPFDSTYATNPDVGVTIGADGNFYGVLSLNGPTNTGAIYKVTQAGEFTLLHLFTGEEDGAGPGSRLLLASDGNFYGTNGIGGAHGLGTFFRITPDGVFTILRDWADDSVGWGPSGDLIQAADGYIYGTNIKDNDSPNGDHGTVYRISLEGEAAKVASFAGLPQMNSCFPDGLLQASDGNFYGVTTYGGATQQGTAYKMTPDGTITILAQFGVTNAEPNGHLVEAADGNLYGTIRYGGSEFGRGAVFKLSKTGTLEIVKVFEGEYSGPAFPMSGLLITPEGDFLGASVYGGTYERGTIYRMTPSGETTVLGVFHGDPDHYPVNKLLQASDGSWYGKTRSGGPTNQAIFKMAPDRTLSIIHRPPYFGNDPSSQTALVEGADGNIYGIYPNEGDSSRGTIFRLTPEGAYSDFFAFDENNIRFPLSLILGNDGNFYGTTSDYGDTSGSLFKLTPTGEYSHLAGLNWSENGTPIPGLLHASDNNFYLPSHQIGIVSAGAVLKVTPGGDVSTLASFADQEVEGSIPSGGVIEASDGNFYGLFSSGGPQSAGTIFKVTPDGTKTTLFTFDGVNGYLPVGELTEGPDGALYGTTMFGGSNWQDGTVFRITKDGEFSTLFNFDYLHGTQPLAGLTRGQDHHLYGTASWGGVTAEGNPAGGGQIFRIRFGAEVETVAANSVTDAAASLNASIQPSGYDTDVVFQYGTSPTLDSFTSLPAGTIPAGEDAVSGSAALAGLSPSTTYYFRAVATNAENPAPQVGEILSFTTSGLADIAVEAGGLTLPDGGFALAGVTRVGQSVDLTFTVRNTAPGTTLGGITASLSGAHAGSFAIVTPPAATLAGATSTTCVVRFTPGSAGIKVAKLSIASSDPDESPFDINLGGIALPAWGH